MRIAILSVLVVIAAHAMEIGVVPKFEDAERDWQALSTLPQGTWIRLAPAWWEACLQPEAEPDLTAFMPLLDRAAERGHRVQVLLWPTFHPTFPQWIAYQEKILGKEMREPWTQWWRVPAHLWQRCEELDRSVRRQISARWAQQDRRSEDLEWEYFNEPVEVSRATAFGPGGAAGLGYPQGHLDDLGRDYMNWFFAGPHAKDGFVAFGHRLVGPSLCKAGVAGEAEELRTFLVDLRSTFYRAFDRWSVNWNLTMNSDAGWAWFWQRAGANHWQLDELANGQKVPPMAAVRLWLRDEIARRIALFDAIQGDNAKTKASFVIDELYCVPIQAMDLSDAPDRARQAELLGAMLDELRASGRFARVMVYCTLRSRQHPAAIWSDYALVGHPAWDVLVEQALPVRP